MGDMLSYGDAPCLILASCMDCADGALPYISCAFLYRSPSGIRIGCPALNRSTYSGIGPVAADDAAYCGLLFCAALSCCVHPYMLCWLLPLVPHHGDRGSPYEFPWKVAIFVPLYSLLAFSLVLHFSATCRFSFSVIFDQPAISTTVRPHPTHTPPSPRQHFLVHGLLTRSLGCLKIISCLLNRVCQKLISPKS